MPGKPAGKNGGRWTGGVFIIIGRRYKNVSCRARTKWDVPLRSPSAMGSLWPWPQRPPLPPPGSGTSLQYWAGPAWAPARHRRCLRVSGTPASGGRQTGFSNLSQSVRSQLRTHAQGRTVRSGGRQPAKAVAPPRGSGAEAIAAGGACERTEAGRILWWAVNPARLVRRAGRRRRAGKTDGAAAVEVLRIACVARSALRAPCETDSHWQVRDAYVPRRGLPATGPGGAAWAATAAVVVVVLVVLGGRALR